MIQRGEYFGFALEASEPFVVAEATLSYVGLGFPEPTPSWGAMLRESSNIRALAEFPWLLAPAVAIVVFTIGINTATRAAGIGNSMLGSSRRSGQCDSSATHWSSSSDISRSVPEATGRVAA